MRSISHIDFRNGARTAVLTALDDYVQEMTGHANARGASDADLPALFAGLDAHMERVAVRLNDPSSHEIGSANLLIYVS